MTDNRNPTTYSRGAMIQSRGRIYLDNGTLRSLNIEPDETKGEPLNVTSFIDSTPVNTPASHSEWEGAEDTVTLGRDGEFTLPKPTREHLGVSQGNTVGLILR